MAGTNAPYRLYVGIAIAADTFTAAWRPPGGAPAVPFTGEQTPTGFITRRRRHHAAEAPPLATRVVLEATGNSRVALAVTLHEAGDRVAVVNPRQAHHCAKARRRRVKTDALDARGRDRRIASLEAAIAAVLAASAWAASLACRTSAPGSGLITAAGLLLVGTRNFARCASPAALAADVGLAPMPRESGRGVRDRPTIGHDGNRRLRTALYRATRSAARYNPIKAFYDRLRAGGKPHQVARCAAARKLLH